MLEHHIMSAKIFAALHQVMKSCGYVQKTGKNTFHGYKYAGEADLLQTLRPAMVEAGLLLMPSVRDVSPPDQHGNVTVVVEYTLAHESGEVWHEKITAVGCGNDLSPKSGRIGDKGVYKALTGANKYLLFKLFQIETGDDPERDDEPAPRALSAAVPDEPAKKSAHRARKDGDWEKFTAEIKQCNTAEALREWGTSHRMEIAALPENWRLLLQEAYHDRMDELRNVMAAG
jgi:hypothetical protein